MENRIENRKVKQLKQKRFSKGQSEAEKKAKEIFNKAIKGDVSAAIEVLNILYGKVE